MLLLCRLCIRSSHALHQSHQPERGLDDRRRHRHPHRRQLLRRPAGGLRYHAGLERGEELMQDVVFVGSGLV